MTELRKNLNTFHLSLYGIGTIIGAGIYVLIGEVAGVAGTYAPLSFLCSALIALFSAVSYAQLSSRFPKSSGEVVYVLEAFKNNFLARVIGYLVLITGIVTSSTLLKGFSGYLSELLELTPFLSIGLLMFLLGFITMIGIKQSVWFVGGITFIEIVGLFFIIYLAFKNIDTSDIEVTSFFPPFNFKAYSSVFSGAFLAFFAYIGFEDLANVAEEAKNPKKSLPIAIMTSMILCTLLYVIVAIVCVLALPISLLANSEAPLAEIAAVHGDKYKTVVAIISMIAVTNGALVQVIMGSRMMYGMSRKQLMPSFFYTLSSRFQTPVRAIVFLVLIIYVLAISFPLVRLASATSFIVLVIFSLVNLSLFNLIRTRDLDLPKTHMIAPIIGFLLCLSMLGFKLVSVI